MNALRLFYTSCGRVLMLVLCTSFAVHAQSVLQMPDGEPIVSVNVLNSTRLCRVTTTRSTVYFAAANGTGSWGVNSAIAMVPSERRIMSAAFRRGETSVLRSYAVACDDGSVAEYTINTVTGLVEGNARWHGAPPGIQILQQLNQGVQVKKILFDSNISMLLGTLVYVNDIKAVPWRVDSVGISTMAVNDIAFDTDGSVIAATSQGLFRRSNSSNTWERIPGIDSTASFNAVFVTRAGTKLYAATTSAVYSREGSATVFSLDSVGLQRAPIVRLVGDANDNVFAVGALSDRASTLFRCSSHAKSWTRIDASLYGTTKSTLRIFDISADQLLDCATAAGCWTSSDMGDTWRYTNDSIHAEDIYAFHALPDGSTVVSTAAAVYRKHGTWSKVFPQNGFAGARPIERANSSGGILATQLANTSQSPTAQPDIYKSADHGQTWTLDTVGLSDVPAPNPQLGTLFAMDRAAQQYLVMSGTQGQPLRVYTAPWQVDTLGLEMPEGQNGTQLCMSICFDAANRAYLSGGMFTTFQFILQRSFLYSRQGARTRWELDTNGLNGRAVSTVCGTTTSTYAGTLLTDDGTSYLYKKSNNQWKPIPAPRAAVSDVRVMCIDSSKVLYVAFDPALGNNQLHQGVYATADEGKTWEYAGCSGYAIRELVATNDAVYAVTNHGVLELSRQPYHPAIAQFNIHDLDLGTVNLGSSKDSTIHISNVGTDTLRVNFLRTNSRNLSATPNTFTVAPGASQDIIVHFAPVQGGELSARMQCVANSSPDTVLVHGFAHAADAHISLQSKFIIFGLVDVGTQRDSVIQVTNTGTEDLQIFDITSTNPVFSASPTHFTVAPHASHDLTLRFKPLNTSNVNGVLNFSANTVPDSLRVLGVGAISSIEDADTNNALGLRISPNPGTLERAMLSMEVRHSGTIDIRVSNEQGIDVGQKFHSTVDRGHFELPLNSLVDGPHTGVLFIHVQSEDGTSRVKCVMN